MKQANDLQVFINDFYDVFSDQKIEDGFYYAILSLYTFHSCQSDSTSVCKEAYLQSLSEIEPIFERKIQEQQVQKKNAFKSAMQNPKKGRTFKLRFEEFIYKPFSAYLIENDELFTSMLLQFNNERFDHIFMKTVLLEFLRAHPDASFSLGNHLSKLIQNQIEETEPDSLLFISAKIYEILFVLLSVHNHSWNICGPTNDDLFSIILSMLDTCFSNKHILIEDVLPQTSNYDFILDIREERETLEELDEVYHQLSPTGKALVFWPYDNIALHKIGRQAERKRQQLIYKKYLDSILSYPIHGDISYILLLDPQKDSLDVQLYAITEQEQFCDLKRLQKSSTTSYKRLDEAMMFEAHYNLIPSRYLQQEAQAHTSFYTIPKTIELDYEEVCFNYIEAMKAFHSSIKKISKFKHFQTPRL